ncbi:LCP family protein [Brevibacterium album]|uniref:LCP family protein n=1 Tax=Brevibacterium album TaxID=417948 RepID=UPI0003FB9775|nr:LCP family protein [Brevibacterium album]
MSHHSEYEVPAGAGASIAAAPYGYDAAGNPAEPPRRGRQRKKRTGRKILAVLAVLVLLAAAAIAGYVFYLGKLFNDNSTQLGQDELYSGEQPVAESGDPINILLLGSDARDEDVDYAGGARGFRSDTIMVMHLDGDRKGAQVMSIPRDMWVPVEGHGNAKINAAMSYGGLPLANQTISEFIDAPIHHVAIIDFEGFKALTDSVGGVTVDSEQSFEIDGHSFTQGENELDGEQALAFVRERKGFADGDLQRARNQQAYLKGLTSKIISADTLSNPNKVAGMVRDFAPYMTVDEKLTAGNIASLAYEMREVRPGEVKFFSAPIAGAGRSADGQAILNVDEAGRDEIRRAFAEDAVGEYADSAPTPHL